MGKNGHKVRVGKLSEFRPQVANANKHTERGLRLLDDAMSEDGYVAPMTAVADNEVIDGSARLERAFDKFNDEAIILEHDGTRPIITVRTDIPNAKTKEAQRIAVRANRIAEVDLEWDTSILQTIEPELLSPMFTDKELAELLSQTGVEPKDAEPQIDKAEELRQKWGTETGQLWVIGNHRLLVGDATNKADVGRLLANNKVDIILTDPPYSSGGFQDGLKRGSSSVGTRSGETIARDNLTSRGFLALIGRVLGEVDADVCYMFTDWRMWSWVFDVLESSGYPVRNMLVWDKGQMGMGFPWRCQHELIAFAKRTPAKMLDGKRGNVLQAKRTGNDNHPTEKPVSLIEDILSNTDGKIIYEPFTGSGTTLIGAENSGRTCYAMEINAGYSAVCLERMTTAFPYLKIEKVEKARAA